MRPEGLLDLIRVRPFVPLRIHVSDGRIHDVGHPDQIIVLLDHVDIGVQPDVMGVLTRVEHVALNHIVHVEQVAPATASEVS